MLKINIEHADQFVASAVAGIVDKALADHGFTNVKGKMVMVVQDLAPDLAHFKKVSQNIPPEISGTELRPKYYETQLLPARIAYGYPVMADWMKTDRPDIFASPVLIDTGIESSPYQEQLKAFKEGADV
jgi:hypothetical protein